jgi:hypothetical protein
MLLLLLLLLRVLERRSWRDDAKRQVVRKCVDDLLIRRILNFDYMLFSQYYFEREAQNDDVVVHRLVRAKL